MKKNSVVALIICLCYLGFSFYSLNNFIKDAEVAHQITLENVSKYFKGDDLEEFSRQLRSAFKYDDLQITNYNRDKVYNYHNDPEVFNFISAVSFGSEMTMMKEPTLGAYIKYRLNHDKLFRMYYADTALVVIIIFLLTALAAFINAKLTSKDNQRVSGQISQLISKEIKQAIDNKPTKDDDEDKEALPIEFEPVSQELSKIKDVINERLDKSRQLEKTAYLDSLTGLVNRSGFIEFFARYSSNEKNQDGVLLITRCSEIATINKIHGYQAGDRYIAQVAKILEKQLVDVEGAQVFRLNGSDFASVIPNVTLAVAEEYGKQLTGLFNEYQKMVDYDSIAYSGIVNLDTQKALGEMLAYADTAISIAETRLKNSFFIHRDDQENIEKTSNIGSQNWQSELKYIIENKTLSLLEQPIHPTSENKKIYHEILARFRGSEGETLPTAALIAMAEKLDKIIEIDRLVVEKTIAEIQRKNLKEHRYGVNLSTRSIHDEHFVVWLERRLLRDSGIASQLIFEVNEYGLEQNFKGSRYFMEMAHRVGSRVCVEHFGVGVTSFKFFKELSPDFIKIDSSYTRNIHEDNDNQFFLRQMIDLAHRLGVKVLAEAVETQEEKYTFDNIFVDGCQGYYLSKPEPL